MKLKHILTVVIVILAVVLGWILITPLVKAARVAEVTVLTEPSICAFPLHYAQNEGIFDEVKVKADLWNVEDPGEAFDALAAGDAEFVLMPWPDALTWMAENSDTLLFGKMPDLAGKTVGVTQWTYTAMLGILGSADIDTADVTLKVYPSEELVGAFEAGEVDVVLAVEPYFSMVEAKGGEAFEGGGTLPQWISSPYYASGLFTTPKFFRKNQDVVLRMNRAMQLAFSGINKASDSALTVALGQAFGVDEQQIVERISLPEMWRAGDIDIDALQTVADMLESYGAIPLAENLDEMGVVIPKEKLID